MAKHKIIRHKVKKNIIAAINITRGPKNRILTNKRINVIKHPSP